MQTRYDTLTLFFKALAHPVRLQILDMLRERELYVYEIEAALQKRQSYVSQQLIVLREAGLVVSQREGLHVRYRLAHPVDALFAAGEVTTAEGEAEKAPTQ